VLARRSGKLKGGSASSAYEPRVRVRSPYRCRTRIVDRSPGRTTTVGAPTGRRDTDSRDADIRDTDIRDADSRDTDSRDTDSTTD
jgi:hypothetical protein